MTTTETAYLAGGCFWGMEDLYRRLPGIMDTKVGYMGGALDHATYHDVRTGRTGHAETIKIVFDPAKTSFFDLLEFFFQIHDPSTSDRQGNDVGTQYRSAIFSQSGEQAATAREVIGLVDESGLWPGKVVTQIVEDASLSFWEAEEFHQDYLEKNPNGYTCHFPRPNWKLPRKSETAV